MISVTLPPATRDGLAARVLPSGGPATRVVILMPLAERRGGCEARLLDFARYLSGRPDAVEGWTVVFLAPGPMVDEVRRLGLRVHVVESGRLRQPHFTVRAAYRVADIVRGERAGMILSWMAKAHIVGSLAGMAAGVSAVWYRREGCDNGWRDALMTLLPTDGVLANSRAVAGAQARLRPRRPTRVVYPGIDLSSFDSARLPPPMEMRRRLGLPPDGPLIGMVGRLQRWKGAHVLLEAMVRVHARYPDASCVIVGGQHALEPEWPHYLARRCVELGLEGRVRMVGLQRDVASWMQAMDVVVHASDREPFGAVVVEAMALGKPVVAGAGGGSAEIITDGVDGLLAPFGDVEILADRILRFLDSEPLRARLGSAAKARATQFEVGRFGDALVDAVRGLVA